MLLALELLRIGELAAGSEHAILRLERRRIRTGRLRQRGGRAGEAPAPPTLFGRLGDLQAGDEAFEITLLFGLEVAGRAESLRLEVDSVAHSAGTCVGSGTAAGAARAACA